MTDLQKSFWRRLLIPFFSCIDYISAYMMLFLWNNHLFYLTAACIASFSTGTVVEDYPKSILYSSVLQVLAAVLAIGISAAPSATYGAGIEIFDVAILWYCGMATRISLFSLPLCIFLAFIGHSIAESLPSTIYVNP